jgi:hypothetical protein
LNPDGITQRPFSWNESGPVTLPPLKGVLAVKCPEFEQVSSRIRHQFYAYHANGQAVKCILESCRCHLRESLLLRDLWIINIKNCSSAVTSESMDLFCKVSSFT